jgi:hypothetical protein
MAAMTCGKTASAKNSDMNASFSSRPWITKNPRGDQKMMIMAFGELIIFLGLVNLSAPGGIHYYLSSIANQNHNSSPFVK